MKKIIVLFLLLIININSLAEADSIYDLQIEGIGLDENALDHFSKEELDASKGYYPKSKRIWRSLLILKDKEYETLQIHMKLQNNKYITVGVAGLIYFYDKENSINQCIKKRNQIVDDLKKFLKTAKLSNEEKDNVRADKSGKSYVLGIYFDFKDDFSEYVKISCTFYTEEYSKETGWPDHLRLALTSTELHNWLKGPAYE